MSLTYTRNNNGSKLSLAVHLLGPPLDQNRLNLKLHIVLYLINNQQGNPEMHLQSHFVLI